MRWTVVVYSLAGGVIAATPVVFPVLRFLPLVVAIMLIALQRSRVAWILVLGSALLLEWASVLPTGAHLLAAVTVMLVGTAALRRVVSTSTWAQLGLAVSMTLVAAEMVFLGWVFLAHALSPAANVPDWSTFITVTARQIILFSLATMMLWPFIRARFAPLHRLHYER